MKAIVFDAGPIISFTANNLLHVTDGLKQKFRGEFLMPEAVKKELVDRPFQIKRFEFEALQVQQQIGCKTFSVIPDEKTQQIATRILNLANSAFSIKNNQVSIVHYGEMSVLASAKIYNAEAVVIDERTTRELVENPENLAGHMSRKFRTNVKTDYSALKELKKELKDIKVVRSAELAAVAYELGLLDKYINKCRIPDINTKKVLLDSVLWGVKLEGCAISKEEIEQIIKAEKF